MTPKNWPDMVFLVRYFGLQPTYAKKYKLLILHMWRACMDFAALSTPNVWSRKYSRNQQFLVSKSTKSISLRTLQKTQIWHINIVLQKNTVLGNDVNCKEDISIFVNRIDFIICTWKVLGKVWIGNLHWFFSWSTHKTYAMRMHGMLFRSQCQTAQVNLVLLFLKIIRDKKISSVHTIAVPGDFVGPFNTIAQRTENNMDLLSELPNFSDLFLV